MEGIFHCGKTLTFLTHGKGGWVPIPPYAQNISTTQVVLFLSQLNPVNTRRLFQYVTLYRAMTQDQVIEM